MKLFKNKNSELRSGWAVSISMIIFFFSSILLEIILYVIQNAINGGVADEGIGPITNIINQGYIFLIAYLIYKIAYRRPVAQLGMAKEKWLSNFLVGILFGLVIFSVVAGILAVTGTLSFTGINPGFFKEYGFFMALSTFSAGFGEEMLCRGLLTFQMKTTRKKWAILAVPSLIFSLLHLMNPGVTVISLVNIILVGVLFGVLLMRTGSLWICIGAHGMWNLTQGALYGIKVSGIQTSGVFVSDLSGPSFLAGGEFGAEGSIVATAVLLLAIWLSFRIFKTPIESGFSYDGHLPLVRYKKSGGGNEIG
jgi:membrane protease YdiL (CAAX protease family)